MLGRAPLVLSWIVLLLGCERPAQLNEACSVERACADELSCCPDARCQLKCARPDAGTTGGSDGGPGDGGAGTGTTPVTCDGGIVPGTCSDLERLYDQAMSAALRCNPTSLVEPCTDRRLDYRRGCLVFVNAGSTDEVDRITCSFGRVPDGGRYACTLVPPGCGTSFRTGSCTPIPDAGSTEGRCESLP